MCKAVFRVPFGKVYTWLNLFTQPAVMTSIKSVLGMMMVILTCLGSFVTDTSRLLNVHNIVKMMTTKNPGIHFFAPAS